MDTCATIATPADFHIFNQQLIISTTLENSILKQENAQLLEQIAHLKAQINGVAPPISNSKNEVEEFVAHFPKFKKSIPLVKDCPKQIQKFFSTNVVRQFNKNAAKILNRRLQPGAHSSKLGQMIPLGSCNAKWIHQWFMKYTESAKSRKMTVTIDGKKVRVERKYYKFEKMPPLGNKFWIRSFKKPITTNGLQTTMRTFYTSITFVVCQESNRVFANTWQTSQCSQNGGIFFDTS